MQSLADRGVEEDHSPAHDDDAPGIARYQVQVMGDHNHGLARAVQFTTDVQDAPGAVIVLPCSRLIEDEHVRLHGQHSGDDHPRPVALGQGERVLAPAFGQAHGQQALLHPFGQCRAAHAQVAQGKTHLRLDGVVKDLGVGVLRHKADAPGQFADLETGHVLAVEQDLPCRWLQQAQEMLDQRGLACAVLAHDGQVLSFLHVQRDALQRGCAVRVHVLQASCREQRRAGGWRRIRRK